MPEIAFPNLIPALPEILLAVAAMLLLMIGVFSREEQAARTVGYGSVIVLIVAIVFTGLVTESRVLTFGGAFVTDPFAVFIKVMTLTAAAAAILMSRSYLKNTILTGLSFLC